MDGKNYPKPCFNGMCFVYYYTRDVLDSHIVAVEMEKLNIESVRIWSHFCWILNPDLTVKQKVADGYHTLYRELKAHGVREIVAMSHYWFLPEERFGTMDCALCYNRDLTPGSRYLRFLDLFEESWFRLVTEFPEVSAWEIGNELNHKAFIKKVDGTDFSWEERIDIATDMMFRGTRAVRRANPSAKVIMPGLAPVNRNSEGVIMECIAAEYDGIIDSVRETYSNIRSGRFGSKNPRDFFDALAWHPYFAKQDAKGEWYFCEPDEEWTNLNRCIYQVAVEAGDEGVECYLTEYGQNDWGNAEEDKKLISYVKKGYSLIHEELPFVTAVHAYRFCDSMGYVGDYLDNYAFYHLENGHLSAKQRTYELQRQYGGTGKLSV